jgi:hypothetical protein
MNFSTPEPAAAELREALRQNRQEEVAQHVATARARAEASRNGASREWAAMFHRHRPALEDFVRKKLGGGLDPVRPA